MLYGVYLIVDCICDQTTWWSGKFATCGAMVRWPEWLHEEQVNPGSIQVLFKCFYLIGGMERG